MKPGLGALSGLKRDVFQKRMIGIAEEMSSSLRRAAYSPIIWDMYDYSCAVLTADGKLLAQAETIPAQLGLIEKACETISKTMPLSTWEDGDVIICNDPYHGCTHTSDVVLFSPVFLERRLVGLTATIAHHVDIGGKTPCTTAPDNTEVFGEGIIFPPMKLLRRGEPVEAVFQLMAANVRNPDASLGDLRAQIAGCKTAERRVREVAAQYGPAQFTALCSSVLAHGEEYMRAALASIGRGSGEATIYIEDEVASAEPMKIHCRVEIDGDAITIDFTGTSEQRPHGLNCPHASTISMSNYAVKAALAPDSPQNGGASRAITVNVPLGTVLNPRRPAAVGSRHFAQQAVAEVVLKALQPIATTPSYAGSQISFASLKLGGFDTRPQMMRRDGSFPYVLITDILGGGGGATASGDGLDAIDTHGGNCALMSAEVMEMACPVRVLRTELVNSSGGVGKYRGGLGLRREYEMLIDNIGVNVYIQQNHEYSRPWGVDGGGPGRAGRAAVQVAGSQQQSELPPKSIGLLVDKGGRILLEGAGGGGCGNSELRDAAARDRDLKERYVEV